MPGDSPRFDLYNGLREFLISAKRKEIHNERVPEPEPYEMGLQISRGTYTETAMPAGLEVLPEPLQGAWEWELWHYSPALVPSSETVDPLSLTLSLLANPDERVQFSLDELKGRFPW